MFRRAMASLLLMICGSVFASPPLSEPAEKSCRAHPQLIGKCFRVHGKLAVYNGTPAVRLRRTGTGRILGVSEQRSNLPDYRNLPESLAQQLNGDHEIDADFLVCPFTKSKAREMQLICIESAKNLVVGKRQ